MKPLCPSARCATLARFAKHQLAERRPSLWSEARPRSSFKGVPADVCNTCGEAFIDEDISEDVYEQAEAAIEAGAHFDVRYYKVPEKAAA